MNGALRKEKSEKYPYKVGEKGEEGAVCSGKEGRDRVGNAGKKPKPPERRGTERIEGTKSKNYYVFCLEKLKDVAP